MKPTSTQQPAQHVKVDVQEIRMARLRSATRAIAVKQEATQTVLSKVKRMLGKFASTAQIRQERERQMAQPEFNDATTQR